MHARARFPSSSSVVRIDSSNATHITGSRGFRFPGEIFGHTAGAIELLRASGHSGRQWSPTSYACAVGNHPHAESEENLGLGKDHTVKDRSSGMLAQSAEHQPPLDASVPHDPFTMLAPEVRRVIREARSRHPGEDFDIRGALLPGPSGDELWRAHAASHRFVLRRRVSGAAGEEHISCEDEEGGACDERVRAVLLAPPSPHAFAWLMRRLLFSQPYPLVAEDVGEHRRGACTWPDPTPFPRRDADAGADAGADVIVQSTVSAPNSAMQLLAARCVRSSSSS